MRIALPLELWPLVMASRWVVGAMEGYQFHFLSIHLLIGSNRGLPKNFLSDRKVSLLFGSEVSFDETPVCAAEVIQRSGEIFSNIDLPVRVGDPVNDLHAQIWCDMPNR